MTVDRPTTEQIREKLWQSFVDEWLPKDSAPADRKTHAVELLQTLGIVHDRSNDHEKRQQIVADAHIITSLLIAEIAPWLVRASVSGLSEDPGKDAVTSRPMLEWLATLSDGGIPEMYRAALDPVALLMPRDLLVTLRAALAALDVGEVQALVAPNRTGKHDDAWTWDGMRIRGVQHVLFLHGKGVTKRVAQTRVAACMGVTDEALRKWERELKTHSDAMFAIAEASGSLFNQLADDPHSWSAERPVTGSVLSMMRDLSDEDLAEFGARYRANFGVRHNP